MTFPGTRRAHMNPDDMPVDLPAARKSRKKCLKRALRLALGEVNKPEPGWTEHPFKGNTFRLGLVHSAAFMGLKVALDSQTVDPVEGIAYLDDIEILFH